MIVANIFVDNQEVINYPVDFVIRNLDFVDKIMLYGGDEKSTEYLLSLRTDPVKIGVENINRKIKSPCDIPTALNECIGRSKYYFDPDFILTLEADLTLTSEGIQLYKEWVQNPAGGCGCVLTQHVKMFIKTFTTYWQNSIIERGSTIRHTEDGASVGHKALIHPEIIGAIDIGYFTPKVWYDKIMQHKITWSSEEGHRQSELFESDPTAFIKTMYEWIKSSQGVQGYIDTSIPVFEEILNYFNAHSEFENVKNILGEI